MDKLFGESFDEYVHKQVNTRQASLAKHQKDVADLQVFNSSTPWVRLTSSIKIDAQRTKELATNLELSADKIEGFNLAKNLVLFAGASKGDDLKNRIGGVGYGLDNAYGFLSDKEQGYKPMPGITGITSKYKDNGSLKQAQVNITCFTRKQFEALEALYLRLGYTVILEWGHSVYFDNNGVKQNMNAMTIPNLMFTSKKFVDPNKAALDATDRAKAANPNLTANQGQILYKEALDKQKLENASNGPHPTRIRKNILKSKEETGGNYDGMLAKIANYSWNLNNDLSYSITVDLVSVGDIIDSLKMNVGGTKLTKSDSKTVTVDTGVQNLATIRLNAGTSTFHSFLYELTSTLTDPAFAKGQTSDVTQARVELANQAVVDFERIKPVKIAFRSALTAYADMYITPTTDIQEALLESASITVTTGRETKQGGSIPDTINWAGDKAALIPLFTKLTSTDKKAAIFFQNGKFTETAFTRPFFALFGIVTTGDNTRIVKGRTVFGQRFEKEKTKQLKLLNYIETLSPSYTQAESNQQTVEYLINQTAIGGLAVREVILRVLPEQVRASDDFDINLAITFDKEGLIDASFIFN